MRQLLSVAAIISVIACNQAKTENKETKAVTNNAALDSIQLAINAALDYHTSAINNMILLPAENCLLTMQMLLNMDLL